MSSWIPLRDQLPKVGRRVEVDRPFADQQSVGEVIDHDLNDYSMVVWRPDGYTGSPGEGMILADRRDSLTRPSAWRYIDAVSEEEVEEAIKSILEVSRE